MRLKFFGQSALKSWNAWKWLKKSDRQSFDRPRMKSQNLDKSRPTTGEKIISGIDWNVVYPAKSQKNMFFNLKLKGKNKRCALFAPENI